MIIVMTAEMIAEMIVVMIVAMIAATIAVMIVAMITETIVETTVVMIALDTRIKAITCQTAIVIQKWKEIGEQ